MSIRDSKEIDGISGGWCIGALLGGVGFGAALVYLFDPDRGRARRARLSYQVKSNANKLSDMLDARSSDLRNRAQGLLHKVGLICQSTISSQFLEYHIRRGFSKGTSGRPTVGVL